MTTNKGAEQDWPILFEEEFNVLQGTLPANWHVEKNTGLPTTAWVGHEGSFDLLSAGNKYIPVIPDVNDVSMEIGFSVNYRVAHAFEFMLIFHYDLFRREGDAVRLSCKGEPAKYKVEFGRVADNIFTPIDSVVHDGIAPEFVSGSKALFARLFCIGSKATVNARLDGQGNVVFEGKQVVLGGNDRYMAMCRKCWLKRKEEQEAAKAEGSK